MSQWIGNDQRLPQGRLAILPYVIICLFGLLTLGFWKLQILESAYYAQLADKNRIRSIPIIAPRGQMKDREGRVLVDNYPSFSIMLLRDDPGEVERDLPRIAEGLGVPLEELQALLEESESLPKFERIEIKQEATEADLAFVESHRADLPVLELQMVYRRRYLRDGFLSHAVGYVGEVSPQQIAKGEGKYRSGDIVGKAGLERQYNEILMGEDGMRRVIVNSVGKEVTKFDQVDPVPGRPIQLTIDYDLQVVAEEALRGQKGAVVALDPRTGEILAMASHPAPDPNLFAVRVKREDWNRLNEDSDVPLLNRAIQAQLAPGSVFKIVMTTAMLESKFIPEDFSVYCPGSADFYGRTFHCWEKRGHGHVELHTAVVKSCDVFFYNVGKRLGIDRIAYYAYQLGLGRKTGVDLPGEESGLVPSAEWKERVFKQKWYAGETISVAVGQGATITTPLQLARTIGGIAMGGVFKTPHLMMGKKSLPEGRFPLTEHSLETVTQAMYGVVNEGGTAAGSRLEGVEFCGKTGTAQLISTEGLKRTGGASRRFTDNAWFVGYAPRRNPEIVVAVLVEHGEHGSSAAAPIARDIVRQYYDKKGQREKKQYTVEYRPIKAAEPLVANTQPAPRAEARKPE